MGNGEILLLTLVGCAIGWILAHALPALDRFLCVQLELYYLYKERKAERIEKLKESEEGKE